MRKVTWIILGLLLLSPILNPNAVLSGTRGATIPFLNPAKAGDLVLVGTVTEIHPLSARRSRKNWAVVLHVDRVVSGEFSGTTFAFAIHSPAQSGLEVGRSYTVKATWTGEGYVVDEAQWR